MSRKISAFAWASSFCSLTMLTFSRSGHLLYKKVTKTKFGYPYRWVAKGLLGTTPTILAWRSTVCRFCRLGTSKSCLPILSCHFTTLIQFLSIDFLGMNKIWLAEWFLLISATALRVWLFCFLKEYHTCYVLHAKAHSSSLLAPHTPFTPATTILDKVRKLCSPNKENLAKTWQSSKNFISEGTFEDRNAVGCKCWVKVYRGRLNGKIDVQMKKVLAKVNWSSEYFSAAIFHQAVHHLVGLHTLTNQENWRVLSTSKLNPMRYIGITRPQRPPKQDINQDEETVNEPTALRNAVQQERQKQQSPERPTLKQMARLRRRSVDG